MNQKEYRYQVIPLTIANGALADSLNEANVQLDPAFNRITGIGVTMTDAGGIGTNILFGARTTRKVWVDPIPFSMWNADSGVGPDAKLQTCNIPYSANDKFYLQGVPLEDAGADIQVYMTLRLEVDLTELPRQ